MKSSWALVVGLALLGPPRGADAGAVEVKIDLAMKDTACVANIDESKKVSRKKRDVLVWNVANTCTTPQEVRVCVAGGKPLHKCNGDPGDSRVGKEFTIEAGAAGAPAVATVSCHVKWDVLNAHPAGHAKKYAIDVLIGPAGEDLKCPPRTVCVGPVCLEGSELVLEVEP